MPKGSRRLTPKQRAERRRRRETGVLHPVTTSPEVMQAPSTGLSAPSQTASEHRSAPTAAAVSARATRATAATPARGVRSTLRQDPFLAKELQRIGVMSVFIFAILVALSVFLR